MAVSLHPESIDLELADGVDLISLLTAIDASAELDTSVLACLSGRWPGGGLIALHCTDTATDAAGAVGDGWLGWQSYESGASWWGRFDALIKPAGAAGPGGAGWELAVRTPPSEDPAELAARIRRAVDNAVGNAIDNAVGNAPEPSPVRFSDVSMTDRDAHLAAVEHTISAIRAGRLYQANICTRIHGELTGAPIALFAAGVRTFNPDHAAFVRTGRGTVVSFSPELFLRRDGDVVRTAPIKGTRRRTAAASSADPAAAELQHSAKDRAENIMIVDLMRNDLSRVSRTDGVHVPQLLAVRPAPGVWHLVSDVEAELRAGITDGQLLAATFPPGSVTGAPKSSAVALIEQLEAEPRGVFTGAVGYLSIDGRSCLNVAIRTFEFGPDEARFSLGVGGGITADSVPSEEWRECLVKAAPLLALGGVRLPTDPDPAPSQVDPNLGVFDALVCEDGQIPGLADHLSRLEQSTVELYGQPLPADLASRVRRTVAGRTGRLRLRIAAVPDDPAKQLSARIDEAPVGPTPAGVDLVTVTGRTGLWRHKWNDRRYLSSIEADVGPPSEALGLFVDGVGPQAVVLETTRSNIAVVSRGAEILTPPLDGRILPGITRRRFLDAAGDRGWPLRLRPVSVGDLLAAGLVLSLNATGVVAAVSLDGVGLGRDDGLLAEIRGWLSVG